MAATSTFNYEVRDKAGKVLTGTLEADSQAAVASKLTSMGYSPIRIEQAKTGGLQTEIKLPGGGKVKLKDLAIFSRQFATMVSSGLSLIRTLSILAEQTENPKLGEVIEEIRDDVEQGNSLSGSIAKHDKVFPKLYSAMVKAGETAGMLDEVMLRIAAMLEADVRLRSKIKSAMTYPVIVLFMAFGLTAAMLIFIVPVFEGMFTDLGGELPALTQLLVTLSDFLTSWLGFLTLFAAPFGLWKGYKAFGATEKGRATLDRAKLKAPVFGTLFHKIALTRFARNLSTLMAAGVPILQAIDITGETVNSDPMKRALKDVSDSVRQGESIAGPLANHEIFPPMVVQMIAVGEETGNIDGMLAKVAEFYDQEVEALTESLTALMEPLMIGVIGAIVGGMVIALYMPMFQVFTLIE